MKASRTAITRVLVLTSALFAAGCVPAPDSTPAPSPAPVQTMPPPAPVATAMPQYDNWMDAPRTPGDWSYSADGEGTMARYGTADSEVRFTLACNLRAQTVQMMRYYSGTARNGPVTIRTETATRTMSATPAANGDALMVSLAARDTLLDAMALTKGRFAVETPDAPTLYLPAWAEVSRVIEDCR